MSQAGLERLALNKPQVALRMLKIVGRRLAEAEAWLEDLAYRSVPARRASVLLRLGRDDVVEGITHEELGDMVGPTARWSPRPSTSSRRSGTLSWAGAASTSRIARLCPHSSTSNEQLLRFPPEIVGWLPGM